MILVPYICYAVSSSSILNNNPERYITSCNTKNIYYGSATIEISELDISTRMVDIGFIYIFGANVINPSVNSGSDYSHYPVYLNAWSSKQDTLPQPIQTPAQSVKITMTVTAGTPLAYGIEQKSRVVSSGNSFKYPLDVYDFHVGLEAPIPSLVNVDNAKTEYPGENVTNLPFGYEIYSRTSGYKITAESDSNNVIHIKISRPIIAIVAYGMPVLILLVISFWLLIIIIRRKRLPNKSNLLIALIPLVIAFFFIPTGVPRPNLFDIVQFGTVMFFSVLLLIKA